MGFREHGRKHGHNCCVFIMGLVSVALLVAALSIYWYSISNTYTSLINGNYTTTYNFAQVTQTSSVSAGGSVSTSVTNTAWGNLNPSQPNLYKLIQTSQSFTFISLGAAAAICGATIMHAICECCSKDCRKLFKYIAFLACIVATVTTIIAWGNFTRFPKELSADYAANSNGGTCTSNPCESFRGSTSSTVLGVTHNNVWGPIDGFWCVVAASILCFLAFALAAHKIFGSDR